MGRQWLHRIWLSTTAIVAIVTALLLLGSAYGGLVDPKDTHWPALLTLAMPAVMAAALIVTVALAVTRHWFSVGIMVVAWLLAWPSLHNLCPLNIFGHSDERDSTRVFKVLTYNVCTFGKINDNDIPTLRYILDQDADVAVLQEGGLASPGIERLQTVRPYLKELEAKYPYRSQGYHDLVLMSKVPYTVHEDTLLVHGDIHSLEYHYYTKMFDLTLDGHPLRIINMHLQSIGLSKHDKELYGDVTRLNKIDNRQRMRQVKHSLLDKLGTAYRRRAEEARLVRDAIDKSPGNLIVCGDINDTPSSFTYRVIRGDDLEDAWTQCGLGPTYTYNSNRFFFKIDHLFYRGEFEAIDITCDKVGNSDHYPLLTTFRWKE